MFTVYVDDSGTSLGQTVAVAGILIIPAMQIIPLDREWSAFSSKYGLTDFHASECAALNPRSYPGWDEVKAQKVFSRARQITKKYTSNAFSFSVYKSEFDACAPTEWRETGGQNHYTWAIRNLMHELIQWHRKRQLSSPFEFVFDRAEGRDKRELEMMMAQFDAVWPGMFEGHYQFRNRRDVPGLQCADLLAWACYAKSRVRFGTPIPPLAKESFEDFSLHQDRRWLNTLTFDPVGLSEAIARDRLDTEGEEFRRKWHADYMAARGKK
ncbi:MAG TPA: DUF3800 domain-containing protein [Acidobacteriaceae bacterium]|jgi:hypothetical protein|nr:DUF3800 domain-containing protein [Acidobacteriaceae bacterium]